jgi:serine/threonine protein kinase/tetratricopeptide (TPR) repeat protein
MNEQMAVNGRAERWQRVKEIFMSAMDIPLADRPLYLASECGQDDSLREEVELLITADEKAGSFMNEPAIAQFVTAGLIDPRRALQPGTVLSARFEILRLIGRGGMGEVYEADDLEIGTRVALKTLRPEISSDFEALARFRNELHLTRRITHPNVCRTFDLAHHAITTAEAGATYDLVYITMELLEGETLAEKLRSGRLTTNQAFPIVRQIAEALDAAHKVGVIHRDLKPGNVMLCNQSLADEACAPQRVVVLDFGLARSFARPGDSMVTMSKSGLLMGTPAYMAPEQLRGKPATIASDIYALGLIIFEIVTGNRLSDNLSQCDPRVDCTTVQSLFECSSLDPQWGSVIQRCLASDPAKRYSNAMEVIAALGRTPSSLTTVGLPERTLTVGSRPQANKEKLAIWKRSAFTALLVGCLGMAVPSVRESILAVLPTPLKNKLDHSRPRRIRSVVLTDIDNNTGDSTFDRSIGELLSTSLDQSPYLKLFPSAKLPEVMKRMNLSSNAPVTALRGLEICKREGLEAEISASISRFGTGYALTFKAIDADGNEIASDVETSQDLAHIPKMVEKGASRLRSVLGEDRESLSKYSAPLEQVTSPSLIALTSYSEGKQRLYDGKTEDAVRYFERALELDPTFAMAREYMGISYNILNDSERSESNYLLATKLTQHVTERERLKIFGDYYLQIKDFAKAISYLKTLSEEYPMDVPAHVNLGQAYLAKYRYAEATSETKAALALQPSVGGQNNLAEIYFLAGDTTDSMGITNEILLAHPNDSRAIYNMGRCHLVRHEFSEALKRFSTLIEMGGNAESRGRSSLADLALAQGRYNEAESQLTKGMYLDRSTDNHFSESIKALTLASAYYDHGKRDKFESTMSELPNSAQSPAVILFAGSLYARAHEISKARKMLQRLESPGDRFNTPKVNSYVDLLNAEIDISQGDYEAAIDSAREALSVDDSILGVEVLARAYRTAGRVEESIREYEEILKRANERTDDGDGLTFHRVVEANYWLGNLYAKIGDAPSSRKYLTAFFDYWPEPDMDAPLYRDGHRLMKKFQDSAGKPTPAM